MKSLLHAFLVVISLTTQVARATTLKVHEWGTFTSVQGSNGETLGGLQHEEEALPGFVHSRDSYAESQRSYSQRAVAGMCRPGCKACMKGYCFDDEEQPSQPAPVVTQKMETPVLYFYSDKPMSVDVTVDFPQGLISQYFPKPTSFLPSLKSNSDLKNGQIYYEKLKILTEDVPLPDVSKGNVYAPARETAANIVQVGGENEKFIFYRGVGNFKTSLKVTSNANEITFADTMGRGVPHMVAVNVRDGKGAFKVLGLLTKNGSRSFDLEKFEAELVPTTPLGEFENQVRGGLIKELQREGLYKDEAESMINTWKLSYFHTEGLRVLYILPREETDALLPIKIAPEPKELERVLIGRIEILTKTEENQILTLVTKAAAGDETGLSPLVSLGRFKEPKLLRVQQLVTDQSVRDFIQTLLK